MLSSIVIIVLVASSVRAGLFSNGQGDDLEALCRNKPTRLTRLSQLDLLVEKLDDDLGVECHDNTASALRDLKAVVEANKRNECSMEAFERYKLFYSTYLDTSDSQKEDFVKLPRSLKHLALAYGVQVASLCRTNMVNRLLEDAEKAVDAKDFREVRELINPKGPIAKALGFTGNRPDEIVLPSDFLAIMSETTKEKMAVKVNTAPLIKRVLSLCQLRFRPVYAPLMLPVAKMANLGFDHRCGVLKDAIQKAMQEKKTSDVVGKWTRVAFMCEIMDEVEILEAEDDKQQSEGNDVAQVQVLSKSEAKELKESGRAKNLLDGVDSKGRALEQIEFKPSLWIDLPDELISSSLQKFQVSRMSTNADETATIRRRFMMKIIRRIWSDVSHYRTSAVFFSLIKEVKEAVKDMRDKGEKAGPSNDLIASLNELVDRKWNPDKAVGESDDAKRKVTTVLIKIFCYAALLWMFAMITYGLIHLGKAYL